MKPIPAFIKPPYNPMKKKTKHETFKCLPFNLTDKLLLTILGLKIIIVITKIIIIDKILLNISKDQNKISPCINDLEPQSFNSEIYIRYGQLDSDQLIHGLGRKICLKPNNKYRDQIIDFDKENTFMEEGEFKHDFLDGTFGRRMYFNSNTTIGWFTKSNDKTLLHGYGKDIRSEEGHFEEG